MLDSEPVSVTARKRLVGGADRGARWRQRLSDQLEYLLRDHRTRLGMAPSAVESQPEPAADGYRRGGRYVRRVTRKPFTATGTTAP